MTRDFAGWERVGGRRLQFYATDEEIVDWLREMLPAELGPYTIIGHAWRNERWGPFAYALDSLSRCVAKHPDANLWIRSDSLSPGLDDEDETALAFSGVIALQLGAERHGRIEDASVAIVDRIRHEETGQEIRHTEYLKIFERLRRSNAEGARCDNSPHASGRDDQ